MKATDRSTDAPAASARSLVIARVAKRSEQFPDLPIASFEPIGLDARDAALARAIDSIVTRRWLTLVAIVESRLDREWSRIEPALRGAFLVGAAQLLFFDRIPEHAAVDETVGWTRAARGAKAAGFVNAVLRKVAALKVGFVPDSPEFGRDRDLIPLGDGRSLRLNEPVFAPDPTLRLAQVASIGRELLLHWIAAHGFRTATALARHGLVEPPTIVTGVPPALAADSTLKPHAQPGWHVFDGDHAALLAMLAQHPSVRVQDPASGDPVAGLQTTGVTPRVIVDVCAGRGTKTAQLAQAFPTALVVASDIDEARRDDLAALATRHENVRAVAPEQLSEHFRSCDVVVLDVPCSNTAVLPRRPEASYRFSARRLAALVEKQRDIVHGAMPLVKPGGMLLYSTCSLEPAENARQSEAIRRREKLAAVAERQRFPARVPGESATAYSDGGYWAVLAATT
ncbi:MAG: transcription antitermination factor NusB [Phycisphaerales bacterium]